MGIGGKKVFLVYLKFSVSLLVPIPNMHDCKHKGLQCITLFPR